MNNGTEFALALMQRLRDRNNFMSLHFVAFCGMQ